MAETAPLSACPLGPFFGLDGKPVAGGRVWFIDHATNLPETVYTDAAGTVAAQNPAPLQGDGTLYAQIWLKAGVNYDISLYAPTSAASVYDPDDFPGTDWTLIRTWSQSSEADPTAESYITVDTVADLVALDPAEADGKAVSVLGYYSKGDCPIRTYLWTAGAYSQADGGAVIASPGYSGSDAWKLVDDGGDQIGSYVWGDCAGAPADSFLSVVAAASAAVAVMGKTLVFGPGVRNITSGGEIVVLSRAILEEGFKLAPNGVTVKLNFYKPAEIRATPILYGLGNVSVATSGTFAGEVLASQIDWTCLPTFTPETTLVLDANTTADATVEFAAVRQRGTYCLTFDGSGEVLTIGRIEREEGAYGPVVAGVDGTIRIGSDFRASDFDAAALCLLDGTYKPVTMTVDASRALSGNVDWSDIALLTAHGYLSGYTALKIRDVLGQCATFAAAGVQPGVSNCLRPIHFTTLNGPALENIVSYSRGVVDCEGATFTLSAALAMTGAKYRNMVLAGSAAVTIAGSCNFENCRIAVNELSFNVGGGNYALVITNSEVIIPKITLGESTTFRARNSTIDVATAWAPSFAANYQQIFDAQGCSFGYPLAVGNGSVKLIGCELADTVDLVGTCSDITIRGCHSASVAHEILLYGDLVDITGDVDISGNTPCPPHDGTAGFSASAPCWRQTEGDIATTGYNGQSFFYTHWGVFMAKDSSNNFILPRAFAVVDSDTNNAPEGHVSTTLNSSGLDVHTGSSFGTETINIHFKLYRGA